MANISINLLPQEVRDQNLKNTKFLKIQTLGVFSILIMFFLASLTIALRIFQNNSIVQAKNEVAQSQQRVSGLKDTESSLYLLKNRLSTIGNYLGTSSNSTQAYYLISKLLPNSVTVSSLSIDKSSDILMILNVPNGEILDAVITNLTSKETNEDKISEVSIDNINRGKDGIYRLSLKVKAKSQ